MSDKKHSLNYFFIETLLQKVPAGYRKSLILFIVHQSPTKSQGKFLFVQEKSGFWNLPKRDIRSASPIEGVFETLVEAMGEEMGLKGPTVFEEKPLFEPTAFLIDIAKQ